MKGFKKSVLFIFIAITMGTLAWVFLLRSPNSPVLKIEGVSTPIRVFIADTPTLRERGLSGHSGLAENEGMFFVFNAPEKLSFWMKDMRFAIDIVWISADWRIVDITKNITPETYPNTFSPKENAQYVLEVSTGFSDKHGLQIGQSATLEK